MFFHSISFSAFFFFFFFNDTATTEIYTLSLHDALPISIAQSGIACQIESRLIQLRRASFYLGITASRRQRRATFGAFAQNIPVPSHFWSWRPVLRIPVPRPGPV